MKTSNIIKARNGCDLGQYSYSGGMRDEYYSTFGMYPSTVEITISNPKNPGWVIEWVKREGFTMEAWMNPISLANSTMDDDDISTLYLHKKRKMILAHNKSRSLSLRVSILCPVWDLQFAKDSIEEILTNVGSLIVVGRINLLAYVDREFTLVPVSINQPEMDLNLNYGDGFSKLNEDLMELLIKDQSDLILFHGIPGSGKSTYIYHLVHSVKKKMIYIPNNVVGSMSDPEFVNFLLHYAKNSVIIVEDAEKVLMKRDKGGDAGISVLLNITDGILGQILKTHVICTFNIERTKIDEALLRKGRLSVEHEFKALNASNANRLFKHLNSDRTTTVPITLAEIYNTSGGKELPQTKITTII